MTRPEKASTSFSCGCKLSPIQVTTAAYARWSAGDWVQHYTGPRFDPRYADVGSLWDPHGRPLPTYQAGQSLAFDGMDLVGAREFPMGFYDPSVPPVCFPATPAQIEGTVSLLTGTLYGAGGSLDSTALDVTIDGGAPIAIGFAVIANAAALLLAINAAIAPGAIATMDPVTDVLVVTTAATGTGASVFLGGSALGPLGLPTGPVTGTDVAPGVGAVSVISRSQLRSFRGERLVIPSDTASNFSLLDVKVGNRSQLANSVRIPAETFVEGAVGVRLSMATAVTAMDIALIVSNQTTAPLPFRGTLIGTTFV